MVWFGIALCAIGSFWFVFAPDAKSTSPSKKSTKKKERTPKKKPQRHKNRVENLKKGVQAFFKEGLDEPRDSVISAADDNRARLDEFIVNEALNDDFVHTPVTNASHDALQENLGHPEQNTSRSLWTTPVSQLTRPQLEMLLKAYFENEGTGIELGLIKHEKPVNHGRQL